MAFRTLVLLLVLLASLAGEERVEFICPMDRDVRAQGPGKCPKCGMKLVAGLPDPHEYPVDLKVDKDGLMTFRMLEPGTGKPVTHFLEVHEKLFHLFLVSKDLRYFGHEHPVAQPDGSFLFASKLPGGGQYRLLCDLYPEGGTPQLVAKTVIVPGDPLPAPARAPNNMAASLVTEPAKPIAGTKTMLFFKLDPAEGLEPYLGAWGHMLAVSGDLIDMIHGHPAFGEGGATIQFNVIFPRATNYKVWVQFQRLGVVNTLEFNVPVSVLQ
ncbi:MAG: heavy metal-binding domain-containing protein [Bryobacteraceae bacterium]